MSPASPELTITGLLRHSLDDVARIVMHHQKRERFGWFFVVELFFLVWFICCIIPVLLLGLLVGSDLEFDVPGFLSGGGAYHRWHEISLELIGAAAQVLSTVVEKPQNEDEGHAIVSSLLSAADRARLVVVQLIGRELVNIWYGGQPLLAKPSVIAK
jgi:hypothetical protein